MALLLASSASRFMTGAVIPVDGGTLLAHPSQAVQRLSSRPPRDRRAVWQEATGRRCGSPLAAQRVGQVRSVGVVPAPVMADFENALRLDVGR